MPDHVHSLLQVLFRSDKHLDFYIESLKGRIAVKYSKIILITHQAFPDRYKPAAHDFDLCCQGRLLIISLALPQGTQLSRQHCNQMNELAAKLVCR